ncbi:23611_t:CDS:2 [Cetraspora pellucida]|uniref:23611_t:CDS:1 n=1 Tax=Cetraspora pellucida TaxID=1433469 RepID=A0A9N9GQV7_9GLOM|nr:23611_t:CDS:2 [Cetraspora pellucida]
MYNLEVLLLALNTLPEYNGLVLGKGMNLTKNNIYKKLCNSDQ